MVSGPKEQNNAGSSTGAQEEDKRGNVLDLMREKDSIEREIASLTEQLKETHNVGMHEELVDSEGFPRNDIDVYRIRGLRHRIIHLQNDHKGIMKRIEEGLHEFYSANQAGPSTSGNSSQSSSNGFHHDVTPNNFAGLRVSEIVKPRTIAKINFVVAGSPADDAGLKVDDEIIQFGSLNVSNFRDLTQVGEIVQNSEDRRVNVKIVRGSDYDIMDIVLVPKKWSGRGLLGCNIINV